MFKRLALATAVAMAPMAVSALESLDDELLGDVTGQEGITIDQSYINTIEEFQYVDGDGDGFTGAGKIVIQGITIDSNGGNYSVSGQKIDAAEYGVLISEGGMGAHNYDPGTGFYSWTVDASGNITSGQDTRINAIQVGNTSGSLNSIGSVTIDNQHNLLEDSRIAVIESFTEASSNASRYVIGRTLISSKVSGTGVIIYSDKFRHIDSITYSDHDGAAEDTNNSIVIKGITQFRQANVGDNMHDTSNYLDGAEIRGAYSRMTLDVEGGKLVLSDQLSVGSTVVDGIYLGGSAGSNNLGSIAILGNRSEGSTSIYAH